MLAGRRHRHRRRRVLIGRLWRCLLMRSIIRWTEIRGSRFLVVHFGLCLHNPLLLFFMPPSIWMINWFVVVLSTIQVFCGRCCCYCSKGSARTLLRVHALDHWFSLCFVLSLHRCARIRRLVNQITNANLKLTINHVYIKKN